MFIQQNRCFKCFINGSNVNKALLTSLTYETIMVISLTMDIEINTTANYTLEEIVLVHMF